MLYESSSSVVSVNENLSTELEITTDVLEGDTLDSFLFIIVLDYILIKTTTDQGVNTHIKEHLFLPDLHFVSGH